MKTSPKGIAFIAAHEGVVTKAYRDVAGVWTIGVGHTAAAGAPKPAAGLTITRGEAFAILARDLPAYERRAQAALGTVAQTIFDGAVSFDFNTGAIVRASWVKAYRAGNLAAARDGLMDWTRAGGRRIAGLVRRREAEARLIFEGKYGATERADGSDTTAVLAYQKQLAALGFYRGALDGMRGPATKAGVIAYQKSHPDLVADGIVGPATRASLARDVAARTNGVTVAAGAAATAALAAVAAPSNALLWAAGVGLAAVAVAGLFVVVRYRGELTRIFNRAKGDRK
jgi:lysozyme